MPVPAAATADAAGDAAAFDDVAAACAAAAAAASNASSTDAIVPAVLGRDDPGGSEVGRCTRDEDLKL